MSDDKIVPMHDPVEKKCIERVLRTRQLEADMVQDALPEGLEPVMRDTLTRADHYVLAALAGLSTSNFTDLETASADAVALARMAMIRADLAFPVKDDQP